MAFVAYPSALAQMPGAQFFSVLFFVMVVCLGVDSQFAMVETVLTALNDAETFKGLGKPAVSALVCAPPPLPPSIPIGRGQQRIYTCTS